MKYLFINSVYGVRSTGKIIAAKCHELQNEGHVCFAAYGREATDDASVKLIRIGGKADYLIHAGVSRLFDKHGYCSKRATKAFLKEIEKEHFDCIWLHNVHGYYLNLELMFDWLRRHPEIKVYWTLHDCWAFTGHCAYFTMARCDKWKTHCGKCPQLKTYPNALLFDHSYGNYEHKRRAFSGVKDLTLITPSQWLADLTRESFLKDYPVEVVKNEIDTSVFKPTPSDFREKNGLTDKHIVLGVAVGWERTKGFQDMMALRRILPEEYVMVLVGVTKKQIEELPEGVIGIERTNNQRELAEIYTAADVLVNPTHQDNYPTVNLETQACGTPVVTYNVGGSPESVPKENVVEENDIRGLAERIKSICIG